MLVNGQREQKRQIPIQSPLNSLRDSGKRAWSSDDEAQFSTLHELIYGYPLLNHTRGLHKGYPIIISVSNNSTESSPVLNSDLEGDFGGYPVIVDDFENCSVKGPL